MELFYSGRWSCTFVGGLLLFLFFFFFPTTVICIYVSCLVLLWLAVAWFVSVICWSIPD